MESGRARPVGAARPGPTVRLSTEEHARGASVHRREDRVVAEEPLEVRLVWPGAPARRAWVTMRTPGQDFELAAGWLAHEGVAEGSDIRSVAYCTDEDLTPAQEFNVVTVALERQPPVDPTARSAALSAGSSACGVCGKDSIEAALSTPRAAAWQGAHPALDVVRSLPDRLRDAQPLFAATGGAHAAALADAEGGLLVVREDVGRHNAVDKVTGSRVLGGEPTSAAVLVVSGRAGFELVQKAVAAGVGTMISVGAPSSLAVALARQVGLTVYGFTSPGRTVRYA